MSHAATTTNPETHAAQLRERAMNIKTAITALFDNQVNGRFGLALSAIGTLGSLFLLERVVAAIMAAARSDW